MNASICINSRQNTQRGIASVEAVLLLPIVLLFIVVLLHVTKIHKTHNQTIVDSRFNAWREIAGVRGFSILPTQVAINGEPIDTTVRQKSSGDQDGLIEAMRNRGDQHYAGKSDDLTQVLEAQNHDMTLATSKVSYVGDRKLQHWKFDIQQRHAVVGTPIWSGEDLPIGYDNYLRNTLNSKLLFIDLFPCARGASSSGQSAC